ncbi:MAG: hypothetical protein R3F48_03305 [Candidatus Zixiibacteriota bacterium]
MSGAAAGGAAAAAIAAAKHAEKMRKEEEELATYNSDDMDRWEFKIVRANTQYFKKPENLRKICDEESRNGWEMVEKFDNYRVRFKRRIDRRTSAGASDIDPYRTQVGISQGPMVFLILGIIGVLTGGLIFAIQAFKG